MAYLNMNGPYVLSSNSIDEAVNRTSPGNYSLGYTSEGTFYLSYVGRSDSDVNSRLKSWVGHNKKYKEFKFSFAASSKEAFEKECKNYHDFGGSEKLDNDIHPDRPAGSKWKCLFCNIFD